jgi:hypothetical protein
VSTRHTAFPESGNGMSHVLGAEPDTPYIGPRGSRVIDLVERGFKSAYQDVDYGHEVQMFAAQLSVERGQREAPLRADVARRERDVEVARAAVRDADERVQHRNELRATSRAMPMPASEPSESLVIVAIAAILYLSTAAVCGVAEVALARITVGPVLGFPRRGPDAWHGWVFAIAMASLVVPLELAMRGQIVRSSWFLEGGRDVHLRSLLRGTAVLAVLATAFGAIIRWLWLLREAELEVAPPTATFPSFFEQHPVVTMVGLLALTLALAVAGALCLGFGSLALERFTRGLRGVARGPGARLWHSVCLMLARRVLSRARRRLARADGDLAGAQSRLQAEEEAYAAATRFVGASLAAGAVLGCRARETDVEAGKDVWAIRSFYAHRAYVASRGLEGVRSSRQPGESGALVRRLRARLGLEATPPLYRTARDVLDGRIRRVFPLK